MRSLIELRVTATRPAPSSDYAAVRELVADVFAEEIEATAPATVGQTVDAISVLKHTRSGWARSRRSSR
jgi:hypothetical protein